MSDKYPIAIDGSHSPRQMQQWADKPDVKLILGANDFPYLQSHPRAELETDATAVRATQLEHATLFAPHLETLDAPKLVLGRDSYVPKLKEANIAGRETEPVRSVRVRHDSNGSSFGGLTPVSA